MERSRLTPPQSGGVRRSMFMALSVVLGISAVGPIPSGTANDILCSEVL